MNKHLLILTIGATALFTTYIFREEPSKINSPISFIKDNNIYSSGTAKINRTVAQNSNTTFNSQDNNKVTEVKSELRNLTMSVLKLNKAYQNSEKSQKDDYKKQIITAAKSRNKLMHQLVKTTPEVILKMTIPQNIRQDFPEEAQRFLEQKVKVKGELEVVQVDHFDNPEQNYLEHSVKEETGSKYSIFYYGPENKNILSGQKVQVPGLAIPAVEDEATTENASLIVNSFDEQILTLAANNSAVYGSLPGALPNTIGERKVLFLMINFQDDPTNKPVSRADAQSMISNRVNAVYNEMSYGQTFFTPTVLDWMTIPLSSTVCDRTGLTNLADEAAISAGYNPGEFDNIIYYYPRTACSWGALGTVGGSPARSWYNAGFGLSTFAHELGHNLGLFHAHDLDCGTVTLGSNCTVREYGNITDLMGSGSGHFNAYEKERLGWLSDKIQTITSSGQYTIAPMEFMSSSRPLALKILKETNETNGNKTWYYIEYRQPVGLDAGLSFYSNGNVYKVPYIHTGADKSGNTSYLLDMTPETAAWYDAALDLGKTYNDSDAGVSITTNWADTSGAGVTIELGNSQPPVCQNANPSLSFSPIQGPWVVSGTSVDFTVTITNNDSAECSENSFTLGATHASGWSTSFSIPSINLAPGESGTSVLSVTSSTTATNGFYEIGVSVASGNYSTTGSVVYVVDNPATSNSAPIAIDDSASTQENTPVVINILANDSDPDGDSLSISSLVGVNGTATINSNGSITFTPAQGFNGTEVFAYTISDGKGATASANVTVTVQAAPSTSDTEKPSIAITSPSNGDSFAPRSSLTITVQASDNIGVTKIEYYISGGLQSCSFSTANSCTFQLPGGKSKSFDLQARAYDAAGNIGVSQLVQISFSDTSSGSGDSGKGGRKK